MRLEITEKQAQMLGQLIAEKNQAESRVNLVIQILAAGAGLEELGNVTLNIEDRSLTFTEKLNGQQEGGEGRQSDA